MQTDQEHTGVETSSIFAVVIQEHLELRRRNAALEHEMPLERYMPDDPFENHPLFKTEEQARVEDTMDGAPTIVDEPTSHEWATVSEAAFPAPPTPATPTTAPSEVTEEQPAVEEESSEASDESLWSRSRDFDWGD